MTDWLEELEAWTAFCANPEALSDQAVDDILMDFLTHVPNHIAAASKIYNDVPVTDVFGVGATVEDEEDEDEG